MIFMVRPFHMPRLISIHVWDHVNKQRYQMSFIHHSSVVLLRWTLPSICHRTYFHTSKGHVIWIIKKVNRISTDCGVAYESVRSLARGHVCGHLSLVTGVIPSTNHKQGLCFNSDCSNMCLCGNGSLWHIIQWHPLSCNEHAVFCEFPAHGLLESTHAKCWNLHIQCESSTHGLLKSMHTT